MSSSPRVLLIDDQRGDILPLIQRIEWLGYGIHHVAKKDAAIRALDDVSTGAANYVLGIIDVMIATRDIKDLMHLDRRLFKDSLDTGVHLCRYARNKLRLTEEQLPIVGITSRTDDSVKKEFDALGIRLFSRVPEPEDSILDYLGSHLPRLPIQAFAKPANTGAH